MHTINIIYKIRIVKIVQIKSLLLISFQTKCNSRTKKCAYTISNIKTICNLLMIVLIINSDFENLTAPQTYQDNASKWVSTYRISEKIYKYINLRKEDQVTEITRRVITQLGHIQQTQMHTDGTRYSLLPQNKSTQCVYIIPHKIRFKMAPWIVKNVNKLKTCKRTTERALLRITLRHRI